MAKISELADGGNLLASDELIVLRAGGNVRATFSGASVVADTTPQLGGNLDLNSNDITGTGNLNITGNVSLTGTVDGRDVATDGIKLDGIETGADVTDTTNVVAALTAGTNITIAADGTISATSGAGGISNVVEDTTPQLGGSLDLNSNDITGTGNLNITGNVSLTGTVDGRDVAADGVKLDGIETGADVTDTTNVVAALTAGTNITIAADGTISAAGGASGISNLVEDTTPQLGGNLDLNSNDITGTGNVNITGNVTLSGTVDGRDVATDGTKLDGIETGADVTDTANVTAAGAVMDSELTNETAVKALNQGVATTDSPTFAGVGVNGTLTAAGIAYPSADGTAGQVLTTDGLGTLSFADGGLPNVYSVTDYGADDSGTSTSHTEIQNAINAASAAGGSVFIPAGDYKVGATLEIPSDIDIWGVGPQSRLFRDTSVSTKFDIMNVESKSGVTLKDFQIDGVVKEAINAVGTRYSAIRIWANAGAQPNNISLDGIHVNRTCSGEYQTEGNRGAVTIEDGYDVSITDCKFWNNRATNILIKGTDHEPYGIRIENCWGTGDLNGVDGAWTHNSGTQGFGSFIGGNSFKEVVISGCWASDFAFSTYTLNGSSQSVINCIARDGAYAGFNIGHSSASSPGDNTVITGCYAENCQYEGIHTLEASNVLIDGNIVKNCGQSGSHAGIAVGYDSNYDAGESTVVTISNNHVTGSAYTGINVDTGDDVFITGNTVADNANRGIFVANSKTGETLDCLVTNNKIYNNATDVANPRSAIEGNSATNTLNLLVKDNMIQADDPQTVQGMGITANGAATTVQVQDNWFSDGYDISHINSTFTASVRRGKGLNTFSSGVMTRANVGNVPGEDLTTVTSTSNAATLDLSSAENFIHTLTENVTYTFSNPAASGSVSSFTLKVTQDSTARTITWPASVAWAGGTAPTLSTASGAVDVFAFFTHDGGTTYYGFTAGQEMQ